MRVRVGSISGNWFLSELDGIEGTDFGWNWTEFLELIPAEIGQNLWELRVVASRLNSENSGNLWNSINVD
jgi:hypothetical protein